MAVVIEGWLLKKKKEGGGILRGSAYQKRWFEVRAETIAYGKEAKDLKSGRKSAGYGESFDFKDLKTIRRVNGDKLEMDFPSRQLRLKAETPGGLTRWHEAIDGVLLGLSGNTPAGSPLASPTHVATVTRAPIAGLRGESEDDDEEQAHEEEEDENRVQSTSNNNKGGGASQVATIGSHRSDSDEDEDEPPLPRRPGSTGPDLAHRAAARPPPAIKQTGQHSRPVVAAAAVDSDEDLESEDDNNRPQQQRVGSAVPYRGGSTAASGGSGGSSGYPGGPAGLRTGSSVTRAPAPLMGSYFRRDAAAAAQEAPASNRPPSPRSLLANPRLAQAMIGSQPPARAEPPYDPRRDAHDSVSTSQPRRGGAGGGGRNSTADDSPPRRGAGQGRADAAERITLQAASPAPPQQRDRRDRHYDEEDEAPRRRDRPQQDTLKLEQPVKTPVARREKPAEETLVLSGGARGAGNASVPPAKTGGTARKPATAIVSEEAKAFVDEDWDSSDGDDASPKRPAGPSAAAAASHGNGRAAAAAQHKPAPPPAAAQRRSSNFDDDDEEEEQAPRRSQGGRPAQPPADAQGRPSPAGRKPQQQQAFALSDDEQTHGQGVQQRTGNGGRGGRASGRNNDDDDAAGAGGPETQDKQWVEENWDDDD